MRAPLRVLHVGPGYGQRGGVASVLQGLIAKRAAFSELSILPQAFQTRSFRSVRNVVVFAMVDILRFGCRLMQIDVVHFHVAARSSLVRKAILFGVAKMFRKKCIFHLHAGDFFDFYERAGGAYRAMTRAMISRSDGLIAVSSEQKQELTSRFSCRCDPIVVGNYSEDFEAASESPDQSQAEPHRYVLFAARLVEGKGLQELLEAILILKLRKVDVHLKIAGTGDESRWRNKARELKIEDRVEFIGWIEGDAKIEAFRKASIFCMPSYFESFGISTLEAMWAARPVVGTRIGGFLDLVEDGVTGYLVDPRDAESLADGIEKLWIDPGRADAMGIRAREVAERKFSSAAIITSYAALYRIVLAPTC